MIDDYHYTCQNLFFKRYFEKLKMSDIEQLFEKAQKDIKTLKGVRETLTADEFMEIVDIAEEQYYQRSITNSTIGMA